MSLFVDGVIFNAAFAEQAFDLWRERFEALGAEEVELWVLENGRDVGVGYEHDVGFVVPAVVSGDDAHSDFDYAEWVRGSQPRPV